MEADPEPETHQRLTWRSKGYHCLLRFPATEGSRDRWPAQLSRDAASRATLRWRVLVLDCVSLPPRRLWSPSFAACATHDCLLRCPASHTSAISSSRVQSCVSACLPLLGSGGEGDWGTGGQGCRDKRSSPASAETVVIAMLRVGEECHRPAAVPGILSCVTCSWESWSEERASWWVMMRPRHRHLLSPLGLPGSEPVS